MIQTTDLPAKNTAEWEVVEPGVITLPTTRYLIVRKALGRHGRHWYLPYHGAEQLGISHSLDNAKSKVARHMSDLLAVGIEP